jgi:hypothetical protein
MTQEEHARNAVLSEVKVHEFTHAMHRHGMRGEWVYYPTGMMVMWPDIGYDWEHRYLLNSWRERSDAMKHAQALSLAEDALNALKPHCERVCIAGSIRRLKPEVKDVEIVCIPKSVPTGLFTDALEVDPDFCTIVKRWPKGKGEPTGKYTQRRLPGGIALDLFMVEPESWGLQLVIRTGSWQFSKYIVGVTAVSAPAMRPGMGSCGGRASAFRRRKRSMCFVS